MTSLFIRNPRNFLILSPENLTTNLRYSAFFTGHQSLVTSH